MNRLTFEEARAKFGDMYCVLIVRQQKRGVIPLIVKDLFDSHYDLVLREREELLGFHRYLKYILCHFEKSDRPTTGAWKGDF
jgi:hypothetical protein